MTVDDVHNDLFNNKTHVFHKQHQSNQQYRYMYQHYTCLHFDTWKHNPLRTTESSLVYRKLSALRYDVVNINLSNNRSYL